MTQYISLEKYNSYRIKSYAKNVYFPSSENEIIDIAKKHQKLLFLGNGSNVIFSKEYYSDEIAFVILCEKFNRFEILGNNVTVQSGALLQDLALVTYQAGLSGIETFYDVPASIGGALIMNAGAYGDEIYTYVKNIKVLDLKTDQVKEYQKLDIDYDYRYSMFKNDTNICILSAEFKRPQANVPVGVMVQELGLKGRMVGDAQISPKHGGIIVNNGNAKGEDIIALIDYIKARILEHYDIKLHEEQIVI
jgi:UDP-N-acetylmuramate dehydrogenase